MTIKASHIAPDGRNSHLLAVPKEAIIKRIRDGFSIGTAKDVQTAWGFDTASFARLVGISGRTLSRAKKRKAFISPTASDRIYRMSKILDLATTVFQDRENALSWLKRPQPGLGNKVPADLLDTEPGFEQVQTLLNQLEYGVLP
ncbi:MAG: DUF2384 domain-containing protein [Elusimicrobiales bacterium]|nr:DUF2384 domain-containing protein [Elusimicrobiales bacterium]